MSSEPLEPASESGDLPVGRLEAFSDGVIAIAITLLVLELAVAEDAGNDLVRGILEQWPSYLAYVTSFLTIGAIWMAHSAITDRWSRQAPSSSRHRPRRRGAR